jgi:hypothetical protein
MAPDLPLLLSNGTFWFKNVNKCWNTLNTFYLLTSGGQNFNQYLTAVPFINTTFKLDIYDSLRWLFSSIAV